MASVVFAVNNRSERLENSLQKTSLLKTPVQSVISDHCRQSTDKLSGRPLPPNDLSEAKAENSASKRTDISPILLEDEKEDSRQIRDIRTRKRTISLVLLNRRVFDDINDDSPPAEWTCKLPGRALTFSDSFRLRHPISYNVINPKTGYRFVQWDKSTSKCLPHATARVASFRKSTPRCPKGTRKATESIHRTPKTNDTRFDVSISILPIGENNTQPSVGDTKKSDVKSRGSAKMHSLRKKGREGAKEKRTTTGQSGDHRQAVYAFAEAFPPATHMFNIQSHGMSEKSWRQLEATVRSYRLKEETLIIRLLKLERLQNLTIEAERKRFNARRLAPNEVTAAHDPPSSDQTGRKGRNGLMDSSRPSSAYSCCDDVRQRNEALVGGVAESNGHAKSIELRPTSGRALHSVSARPSGRYAWLSAAESKALVTLP